MGVISIRRGLMPGFTELAADMDLAAHLGTELFGVLIRLAHIAEPAVDLPGSWVVNQTQGDLASFLGFSTNKCQRVLADLVASGTVVKDAGLRLGRGMGSTNSRYFIAAVPGLTVPAPTEPNPPRTTRTNRDPQLRELNIEVLQDSVLETSALQSVSASQSASLSTPDSTHVMNMMNESSSDEVKTASSYSPLSAALARIGWSAPIPVDQDPVLLAAVATWMHGQTRYANKAAYLHTLIKKNEVATFAAAIGVPAPVSSTYGSTTPTPNSHFMSSSDYVALSTAYPDWADQVVAQAQVLATERGCTVRMALLCEVATTVPVPTDSAFSSANREVTA